MPLALESAPAPVTAANRRIQVMFRAGWPVAMMLVTLALGLRALAMANTDLPAIPDFLREVGQLYGPDLRGETGIRSLINHAPGAHAWARTVLGSNQQWDARVLSVGNLGLLVVALGTFWSVLKRAVDARWFVGLNVGLAVIVGLAPTVLRSSWEVTWAGGLLLFSFGHLAGMSRAPSQRGAMLWGFGCGVLNVVTATAGVASALALVLWLAVEMMRDRAARKNRRTALALNALLALAGIFLAISRSESGSADSFSERLHGLLSWPAVGGEWIALLWVPAAVTCVYWLRQPSPLPKPRLKMVALLATWTLIQMGVLAGVGVADAQASFPILIAGLIVNAACFSAFPKAGWGGAVRNQALLGLWAIMVLNLLLYPTNSSLAGFGPPLDAPLTAALRRVVNSGDGEELKRAGVVNDAERRALASWLADPALRRVLPGSIRQPLPAEPSTGTIESGFRLDAAPQVAGRDELPAWGTWTAANAGSGTGEWVSAPIESEAAFVQLRVAGELRPGATSVVLRSEDGTEIAPMEAALRAENRWRRINFAAPRGPFRIVARDVSPAVWLAFTAPQEIGRLTWLAGKVVKTWPVWLVGGLFLGGVSGWRAWLVRRKQAKVEKGERVSWPLVPWLALVAYAVFFSHHIDGTAGPNDSGGYLNSAKLLIEGNVTGAPRMIFGPQAGETDVTPYLPTTFHATADGRMAPEYPVGFPLEIWAVAKLTSLDFAVPCVTLLQLVLGVFFTRQLARAMGLGDGWAWLAAGIVGLSPVYLFQALQPQSDGPALVWVTAAVCWAWQSREQPWQAGLAGAATALAVMIRPSNLLCVVPILLCFSGRGRWRQLAWWTMAGIPAAAWQLWYNHRLYGNAFTTGYGDIGTNFGLQFAPLTWASYARWLPVMFTPVVVLAIWAPFSRAVPGAVRAVLGTWAAVFLAFYTFYWCTYDNWYNMRFVLPAAPAMVVLGLFVVRTLTERAGLAVFPNAAGWRTLGPSAALVVALLGIVVADTRRREVVDWMHTNRNYAVAGKWARDNFPAEAVVFAKPISSSLYYYTDLVVVRSDHERARSPEFFARIAATGRPIFAVTSHWERKDFKWGAGRGDGYPDLPGRWERLATLCDGEILTWRWHPE